MTDPDAARTFVERTGVDALAVNVGQAHLHGKATVRLDLERLSRLRCGVPVPLVLHGASSVDRDDLKAAIRLGVRKINVGTCSSRHSFSRCAMRACALGDAYNPYEAIGSGLDDDVTRQGAARDAGGRGGLYATSSGSLVRRGPAHDRPGGSYRTSAPSVHEVTPDRMAGRRGPVRPCGLRRSSRSRGDKAVHQVEAFRDGSFSGTSPSPGTGSHGARGRDPLRRAR